jgi:hypothetical protein
MPTGCSKVEEVVKLGDLGVALGVLNRLDEQHNKVHHLVSRVGFGAVADGALSPTATYVRTALLKLEVLPILTCVSPHPSFYLKVYLNSQFGVSSNTPIVYQPRGPALIGDPEEKKEEKRDGGLDGVAVRSPSDLAFDGLGLASAVKR